MRNILKVEIEIDFLLSVFVMIVGALINYLAQFHKTYRVYDKSFNSILLTTLLTTIATITGTYAVSILNINIMYPLLYLIISLMSFWLLRSTESKKFYSSFLSGKFIWMVIILVGGFILTQNILNVSWNILMFLSGVVMILLLVKLYMSLIKMKGIWD